MTMSENRQDSRISAIYPQEYESEFFPSKPLMNVVLIFWYFFLKIVHLWLKGFIVK
jgi:hypothetical protein